MTLLNQLRRLEKLSIDNSPVILTAIGVVGTIGTAVLTHRSALKADLILKEEKAAWGKIDTKNAVKAVWKEYIPPVASGALTIGAIIMANRIGTKRAAALAAAYTISEKAYSEYREKVIEHIGVQKEQTVRDEVAKDRLERNPVVERDVIIAGGDVMCYDMFTGRYFQSDMEKIRRAENDINQAILATGYQSLSDFYERIGLPATSASEEVGWTTDKMLTVEFSAHMSSQGKPCIAIDFLVAPVRGYYKYS